MATMRTIKGPAIFLAQFAGDAAPFDTLKSAQFYRDFAEQIHARLDGRAPDPACLLVPGIADGVRGMRFIAAAVASSRADAGWTGIG